MMPVEFLSTHAVAIAAAFLMLALALYIGYLVYTKQTDKLKGWVFAAVVEVERQMKAGTGPLKLEAVYKKFVEQFPVLKIVMPRDTFDRIVEEALNQLKQYLQQPSIKRYVQGEDNE